MCAYRSSPWHGCELGLGVGLGLVMGVDTGSDRDGSLCVSPGESLNWGLGEALSWSLIGSLCRNLDVSVSKKLPRHVLIVAYNFFSCKHFQFFDC